MPSPWCLVRVQWQPLPSCPDLQPPRGICSLPHVLVVDLASRAHSGPSNPPDHRGFFPRKGPERRPSKDSGGQRGWSVPPLPCWLRSSSHAPWGRAGGPRACCKGVPVCTAPRCPQPSRLRPLFWARPWLPVPPSARRLAGSGDGGLQSPRWLSGRGPHSAGLCAHPRGGEQAPWPQASLALLYNPQYHALGLL